MTQREAKGGARELDAEALQDLRHVEACSRTFSSCGERLEWWELFTLLKSAREEVLVEVERLEAWKKTGMAARMGPDLRERLSKIRDEFGPLASRFKRVLHESPMLPLDPENLDLAMVFLMGTDRARASVSRWLADPAGSAAERTLRLRILSKLAETCRKKMSEAPAAAAPVSKSETSLRRPGAASSRLKPALVENLRRLDRSRDAVRTNDHPIGWEIYYLASTQTEETGAAVEELARLKASGKPGEYPGEFQRFLGRVREVRQRHEAMIPPLRSYLTGVFGTFGGERDELALALLIGSPEGRHLVRQWLDDQALCHDAAVASLTILRARASAYFEAARNPAAALDPQRVA